MCIGEAKFDGSAGVEARTMLEHEYKNELGLELISSSAGYLAGHFHNWKKIMFFSRCHRWTNKDEEVLDKQLDITAINKLIRFP